MDSNQAALVSEIERLSSAIGRARRTRGYTRGRGRSAPTPSRHRSLVFTRESQLVANRSSPQQEWVKRRSNASMALVNASVYKPESSTPRPRPHFMPQKSVRRGDMGEVVVDGVTFVFDETGTKLVKKGSADAPQISTAQTSTTPLQTSVHGEDYVRTKRGNLINKKLVVERRATRAKALQAEHSATPAHTVGDVQSKLRPLHTPRALCNYYTRTGACRRGIACPFQHDPSKRAICPGVLKPTGCVHPRGACLLSHTPSAHSMPHCVHYLRTGTCRNGESCEYTHTRMAPDAPLCRPFSQLGWCDEGAACVQRHARECPDFSAQGACKSKGCRLAHVDRAAPDVPLEPGPDTLFVRDDSGAAEETRYFDEAPEPEQLHAETMHGSTKAFAQQRDFISLDDAPVSDTSDTESVLSYATAESDEEVERILSI